MNARSQLLAAGFTFVVLAARPVAGQDRRRDVDPRSLDAFASAAVECEKAGRLFAMQDLPGAKRLVASALRLAPGLSDAHFLLAKIHYAENDDAKALEEIVAAEGGHAWSSFMKERMQDEPRARLRRLRRASEASIEGYRSRLGTIPPERRPDVEARLERETRAKEEIDRQLVEMPRFDASIPADYHFVHGHILMRLNHYDGAAAQYEMALNRQPGTRPWSPAPPAGASPGC